MKLIKISCAILCFFFVNASGMSSMPFRIGFEFQMNGRLCEWALHAYSLQKKPIITMETSGAKLCHIELDGPDVEFVTEPFSDKEKGLLATCTVGIKAIIDITKTILNSDSEISLDSWLNTLISKVGGVQIKALPFFENVKTRTIKKLTPAPWEPSWQPQITVQHPLRNTIVLCNTLFPMGDMQTLIKQSTPTKMLPNTAIAGLMFLVAHEMVGMANSYLMPLHPDHILDLAMALAIYFQGQDLTQPNLLQLSINALSDPRLKEFEAHPLMRAFLAAIFEQDTQKGSELLSKFSMEDPFIKQALPATTNIGTFLPIANDEKFMYKTMLMRDTFESFSTAHQFDAKRWTNFMSRRPFSHMFYEIVKSDKVLVFDAISRSTLKNPGDFLKVFNQNIDFADQLPNGFYMANYAEQFFDGTGSNPLDLRTLLPYFNPTIRYSVFLAQLLQNGIFSTTMCSVMEIDEVPNTIITLTAKALIKEMQQLTYSDAVLASIEQPKERGLLHIIKDGSAIKIDVKQLAHSDIPSDLLSPPFLLDESDAMGRYREGVFHTKHAPETFGSAIIEFRNIQQAKQLKSKINTSAQVGFLTVPDFIEEETLSVFDALSKLTVLPPV
jgi:hypothetical protein